MPFPRRPTVAWLLVAFGLLAANLALQLVLGRAGYDDQPVNAYRPTSSDALVYVAQATMAAAGEFRAAFAGGFRPPGYPVFLAACLRLFDRPWLAARLLQAALTALIIPLSFATLAGELGRPARALAGTALVALWLPLYYFAPVLTAEGVSLFALAVALWLMARAARGGGRRWLATAGLAAAVAALVYLKPNHVFLALPVAVFLGASGARGRAAAFAGALVLLLLPWTAFISAANGRFIPLSTTSGINLYLGTGSDPAAEDGGGLPGAAAARLGLADAERATGIGARAAALAPAAQDALYSAEAAALWRARFPATALYGLSKAAHAFGFSLRGGNDLVQVGLFGAALAASFWLWRAGRRPWALFLWAIIAVTALQAFLFLGNQRFKVVLFDLPALLVIGLAAGEWLIARTGDGGRPLTTGP